MSPRKTPPICHADYVLPFGETVRSIAVSVSLGGAFIVSMSPPPIGTKLLIALSVRGVAVSPHIVARVIGVRLDPGDATRSGFEVLFAALQRERREVLARLASALAPGDAPIMGQFAADRDETRAYPRVAVHLMAQVRTCAGNFTASVKNISMSGALLVVDDPSGDAPLMLELGARLHLTLISGPDDGTVELVGEVVRWSQAPEPTGIGVRFANLEGPQTRRLEELIVYSVIMDHFPYL